MKPLLLALLAISSVHGKLMPTSAEVFGEKYSRLDDRATSDWWKRQDANKKRAMINPHSPPSAPVQRRLQGTPAKSKFLAVNPHSPPSAPVQRRLQGTPAKSKFLAVNS